jgi:hypothetical protein
MNPNEQIVINASKEVTTLNILHGEALEPKEPNTIFLSGVITCVLAWLLVRVSEIKQKLCFLIVDRDNLSLSLTVDEKEFYNTTIVGKLEVTKEFLGFGINTEKTWDPFKLSDFIKMNRSFFASRDVAMQLVTDLRNFKATVNKEIEKFKDDRANYDSRLRQVVESNLPETFVINIPIFKGEPVKNLLVEISIDPISLQCSLVSPDACDYINEQSNIIIDQQLKEIKSLCPDLAIIEK